jgi:signal transduction histidine kinase
VSTNTDKTELIAHYSQLPLDSKYMRLVAHDVRNQMNTIMMATDMLKEELHNTPPEKYVSMISRASEDILVILEAAVTALNGRDTTKTTEDL